MNEAIEKRTDEMISHFFSKSYSFFKDLIEERDQLIERIKTYKTKLQVYEAEEIALLQKLAETDRCIPDSLAEGKEADLMEQKRDIRINLENTRDIIKSLKEFVLPQEKQKFEDLRKDLRDEVYTELGKHRHAYSEAVNEKIKNEIELELLSWEKARRRIAHETDVPAQHPLDGNLKIQNKEIERFISNSFKIPNPFK